MIEVSHLTKAYGNVKAVNDLSFKAEPGQVTGFLGPNGAGKSTTMRMILGLDRPTSGEALVGGKRYQELKYPAHEIGVLLDAKAVHPNRSAANHLRWIAASNGISRKRVDEVLGIVGLSEVAGKKVGGFSLGMGQRLGLATALLGDPHTIMLDEPVNGLDPEGIRWVRDMLKALAAQGCCVLVSSHLLAEMALTADHLVVIARGQLVSNSSTYDFVKEHSASSVVVRSEQLGELKAALGSENLAFTEVADEEGRETLVLADQETDLVGQVAYSYGIPLLELTQRRASLEDAYLAITGELTQYRSTVAGAGSVGGTDSGSVEGSVDGSAGAKEDS